MKNNFTRLHQTLHWTIALASVVLFFTGFLRMEWMGKEAVMAAIQSQGIEMSKESMKGVYKALRKPMWNWHIYAAYLMFFSFGARIIYMMIKGIKYPNPFDRKNSIKARFQGLSYSIFYLFLLESTITGFYLLWFKGDLKDIMEDIHKWGLYIFPAFIVIHMGGILIAELTSKNGVVSKFMGNNKDTIETVEK